MSSAVMELLKDIPLSAVLKEKLATWEAKASELETERDILQSKLRNAESHIYQLKQEIEHLQRRLAEATAEPERLHEKAETILKAFAEHSESRLTKRHISTELLKVELDYYWDDLKKHKFIEAPQPPYHSLTQKGRKYVMDHLS